MGNGDRATLLIEDDGVGFDAEAARRQGTHGLVLIETLAGQIDAAVRQVSAASGTAFTLTLPAV